MSTQPGILDSALLDIGNSSISFFLFVDDEDTLTQLWMGNQTCQLEMGQMSEIQEWGIFLLNDNIIIYKLGENGAKCLTHIALFFSLILTLCYFLRGYPCSETQSQCVRVGMPVAEGDADWTECRLAIIILSPPPIEAVELASLID